MDGVRVQVKPLKGEMDKDRVTVPEKALTGEAVTVETPVVPASSDMTEPLVAREKSWIVKVTEAEWDINVLAATTLTM